MSRILTTHTGSLHRRPELLPLLLAHVRGEEAAGLDDAIEVATTEIVREQFDAGLDVVNDGEQGKPNYAVYIIERLAGFEANRVPYGHYRDVDEFPDFGDILVALDPARFATREMGPACTGPIAIRDPDAVHRDIARLKAAALAAGVPDERLFMTAASPGVIAAFVRNDYYPSQEDYIAALIDVMRIEYRAIVEAGFTLQLDCPDFAMRQGAQSTDLSVQDIRRQVAKAVEALNAAVSDLPAEKMRLHLCWGNNEAPHVHDVELRDIIDIVAQAHPAGIALEAANPRHGHEWQVFEDFTLPDDKYVLPGVIDTTTNFVEHPELVAQRLRNYTRQLGNSRVIATTDCGFGTFAGRNRVARSVAWAKLRSMVEGAELATRS